MKSGLYIVTLNNEELISVNANDPRIADKCIKVNRVNCKFGKARDLSIRKRNYDKVFGAENVNFFPLVALDEMARAERLVLALLSEWRIRGATGRKNEWLTGISAEQVQKIAISALAQSGLSFQCIDVSA